MAADSYTSIVCCPDEKLSSGMSQFASIVLEEGDVSTHIARDMKIPSGADASLLPLRVLAALKIERKPFDDGWEGVNPQQSTTFFFVFFFKDK